MDATGRAIANLGFQQMGSPSEASAASKFRGLMNSQDALTTMQSPDWSPDGFVEIRKVALDHFKLLVEQAAGVDSEPTSVHRRRKKR